MVDVEDAITVMIKQRLERVQAEIRSAKIAEKELLEIIDAADRIVYARNGERNG